MSTIIDAYPWLLTLVCVLYLISISRNSYAVVLPPPQRDYRVRVVEAVLLAEARGEGPGGIRRVAEVVRNRMVSRGQHAIDVVTGPKQFSCLNGTTTDILLEQREGWQVPGETVQMAQWCASQLVFPHGARFGSSNITRGATHYHAAGPKPWWTGNRKPCHTYKNHIFYRLN
jgi:N-acetylmuramoyl-L-alanine amidase